MKERRPPQPFVARCKLVLVGDVQCGKTAMLQVFVKDSYPETYVPTVFENYTASLNLEDQRVELSLWDTSGSPYYDNVRPLCYSDSDAVLLCFDISRPDTVDAALKKVWRAGIWFSSELPFAVKRSTFSSLFAVESRNSGLLSQHSSPPHRLQDRPAHRRLHTHGAVPSETGSNLPGTGSPTDLFTIKALCSVWCQVNMSSGLHFIGFMLCQAAGSCCVPGVLGLHVREEHPQRLPYRRPGLHQQAAGCGQTQPGPPPLQKTAPPAQQDRATLLQLQQGQVQKLLHHVKPTVTRL
uniref:Rho family GTPase 1 n=1 Tax=Oryzias melastigma TaxID=30732 RepID=A0A3B3BKE8_ORYME